jgi:hypothetical protein
VPAQSTHMHFALSCTSKRERAGDVQTSYRSVLLGCDATDRCLQPPCRRRTLKLKEPATSFRNTSMLWQGRKDADTRPALGPIIQAVRALPWWRNGNRC